jgi:carotenoid cleavage dioxygenase-like enzyme
MALSYANNPAFTGFFKPTRFEGEVYDCEVYGDIPADLVGTYYRLQPDPEYPPRSLTDLPLTGDGHLSMFRFVGGGHLDYKSRYVKTARLLADRKAHQSLFGVYRNRQTDDPRAQKLSGSAANTNVVWHAGKLLALDEDGPPVEVDPHTLETKGVWTFDGKLTSHTFGAHPKLDPKSGELIAYGAEARGELTNDVVVYTIDPSGRIAKEVWLKAPYVGMVHDIAITQKHVIIPITGFTSTAERLKSGQPHWAWDASKPTYVAVLPRHGTAKDVRWFKGPPRFAIHTINAVDEGDKVVLTLPVSDANPDPMYPNLDGSASAAGSGAPSIRKWTFDLSSRDEGFKEEVVFAGSGFVRIDERYTSLPNRYLFKGYADAGRPFNEAKAGNLKGRVTNSYQRVDLGTGQASSYFVGDVQGLLDCCFVPRSASAAEGDGYLIGVANNYGERKSELVIVDAQALEKGALATVKLPFRLRPGTHGTWAPVSQVGFPVFAA